MDLLAALGSGFLLSFQWPQIGFLLLGVALGLFLGIIPGLGGVTGMTLLLPLAFTLDLTSALAMMLALTAVTSTADTLPAVVLGVPGTSGAAATVMDGHPMAKQGRAAEALGAAYISSAIGGVIGALVLVAAIPILRPITLAFGPPEIFMLAMWGLVMVGALGSGDPLRGWAAGGLGVLLATVGRDPIFAGERYSFGEPALWDGLPLIAVALGLFAIPELIGLLGRGTAVSRVELPRNLLAQELSGIRQALQHWWILIRCAAIGTWVGFLPGLGSQVADWFAYAHAKNSSRDSETFGTGDIRGVVAPEASNNSVKGGELIPTLAFGVPGSASMAILFGALLIAGIEPGRELLTTQIDLSMTLVWTVILANIFAAGIVLTFTRFLVLITRVPGPVIVAIVAPVIVVSTFAFGGAIFHLVIVLAFGLLGFIMKQLMWPRAALLVGFVLGSIVETNFVNSVRLFGYEFLFRPLTAILFALVVLTLAVSLAKDLRR